MKPTLKHAALCLLVLLNGYVWYSYMHVPKPELHVSVLDIGQGDSIFIEGPTGIQMLIDGGPDRTVLRRLPREMNILDRSIDLVVETHPDADHIAGLTSVIDRYRVSYFMSPNIPNETSFAASLTHAVDTEKGLEEFIARRGMRIHLGGGAYADVLYPDKDVSQGETNDGSIVMRVVYGSTSFMLTGDAPSEIEEYLIAHSTKGNELRSTVLKAGHHGSKYSSSDAWLSAVHPKYVAISAGENNRYGHPNSEAIGRIKNEGAGILSTIQDGTIHFVSDGDWVTLK